MIQLIGLKSNCDITIREKFAIVESKLDRALENLCKVLGNVAILSTCNRTEIFIDSSEDENTVINLVFQTLNWDKTLMDYVFYIEHRSAVKHLMEVICGFHSKILGEDQILGQVKDAYTAALRNKTVSGRLERLFQQALTCGKKFKDSSEIYKIPVSSSAIAAKDAMSKGSKNFMIIGFGTIGQSVLKYLTEYEKVYIVVRDVDKVLPLVKFYNNIKVFNFEDGKKLFGDVECIISCTSAPHTIVHNSELPLKRFLIYDLAVPRDVEREIADLPNIELYDIDHLSDVDEKNKLRRKIHMEKYRFIIEDALKGYMDWWNTRDMSIEIQKLKATGENVAKERSVVYKNKKYTKDNDELVSMLLQSASNFYVNNAIEVLKEEKLKGKEEECLSILKRIFYPEE